MTTLLSRTNNTTYFSKPDSCTRPLQFDRIGKLARDRNAAVKETFLPFLLMEACGFTVKRPVVSGDEGAEMLRKVKDLSHLWFEDLDLLSA